MNSSVKAFTVVEEDESFTIGRFDGETYSGVYLGLDSLQRLGEVLAATKARLSCIGDTDVPDALKNLVGILDRLLATHRKHVLAEFESGPDRIAYEAMQDELRAAVEALSEPNGDDDGPRRA
jgi:hypothetical protein